MKEWLKMSLLLCLFGLMRDNRPSEVFVTEYLTDTRWRNITQEEVNTEVYPVGTYSYAAQLVLVFLVTDFLRYKPLIILIGICGIIIWSLLIWTTSLEALQAVEFFYGTYMAAEVAYYTYIYAKVDKKYYSRITSHARAAMLCGKLIAGISSQLLINYKLMDYKQLNYITLASQICATIWAFLLPSVDRSLYFHRKGIPGDVSPSESSQQINNDSEIQPQYLSAFLLLWSHLRNAYTNPKVIQWSLWYSVGLCGHLQIVNYIQILWKHTGNNPPIAWNGAVESVLTFLGAVSSLAAGYIHAGRLSSRVSLLLLVGLSLLEGSAILFSAWTTNLYLCYAGYIIFGALFAFTITVASAEVAKHLEEDSYGLVFGINTFLAVILQSILTMIVVSPNGLGLGIIQQFTVYAFYFVIISLVYFVALISEYIWNKIHNRTDVL